MAQYLSIKDVAEWLNVDYKTIYRLIRQQELPAAKVGGVYRIRREDVQTYVERQFPASALEDMAVPQGAKCAVCQRLLHTPNDVGGVCMDAGCEAPICATCWQTDKRRYCAIHQPLHADLVRETPIYRPNKGSSTPVLTAQEARRREQQYITRFDTKVRRITKLWHPVRQQVISPSRPWEQLHRATDEVETLMALLHTGFLDETLEREMPLNVASRYTLPGAGAQQPGLILEAQVLSPLSVLVKEGFATEPLSMDVLAPVLERCVQTAEAQSSAYLIGIVATTGWAVDAIAAITGGETGQAFSHPLVLPCLVDLESLVLTFNTQDTRIAPLASLFAVRLPEEELEHAIALIERELRRSHSVAAADLLAEPGMDTAIVGRAFARLVQQGTHRIETLPDIGEVIVRTEL